VDPWLNACSLVIANASARGLEYDRVAFLAKSLTQGPYDKALNKAVAVILAPDSRYIAAVSPPLRHLSSKQVAQHCEPCAIIV
jgi:hypothetical protein